MPHHLIFTRRFLFLMPNQQRQSTEDTTTTNNNNKYIFFVYTAKDSFFKIDIDRSTSWVTDTARILCEVESM